MVDQHEQRLTMRFERVRFSNFLGPIKYLQRADSPDPDSPRTSRIVVGSLPAINGMTFPGRSRTSVVANAGMRGNRKLDCPS